jgi:hypothetical protein
MNEMKEGDSDAPITKLDYGNTMYVCALGRARLKG